MRPGRFGRIEGVGGPAKGGWGGVVHLGDGGVEGLKIAWSVPGGKKSTTWAGVNSWAFPAPGLCSKHTQAFNKLS